jgi:hypothetical protein
MFGRREKYLALAVIAVLVAYVADRLILTPALNVWRNDGERLIELRSELAESQSLAEAVPGWERELERRQGLAYPIQRSEAENDVLNTVAARAVARRLQLAGTRLAWREAGTSAKGAPAQLELSISANGSLAAVAGFLYDMETLPNPVRVSRMRWHAQTDKGSKLDVDLTLSVLSGSALAKEAK